MCCSCKALTLRNIFMDCHLYLFSLSLSPSFYIYNIFLSLSIYIYLVIYTYIFLDLPFRRVLSVLGRALTLTHLSLYVCGLLDNEWSGSCFFPSGWLSIGLRCLLISGAAAFFTAVLECFLYTAGRYGSGCVSPGGSMLLVLRGHPWPVESRLTMNIMLTKHTPKACARHTGSSVRAVLVLPCTCLLHVEFEMSE